MHKGIDIHNTSLPRYIHDEKSTSNNLQKTKHSFLFCPLQLCIKRLQLSTDEVDPGYFHWRLPWRWHQLFLQPSSHYNNNMISLKAPNLKKFNSTIISALIHPICPPLRYHGDILLPLRVTCPCSSFCYHGDIPISHESNMSG